MVLALICGTGGIISQTFAIQRFVNVVLRWEHPISVWGALWLSAFMGSWLLVGLKSEDRPVLQKALVALFASGVLWILLWVAS